MKFKTINTIICSTTMSVITVSAIFLAEIIGIANELFRLPYLLVVAVIYAAMLLSESKKQLLLKWVLSLPFSFFCFEYFWQTHYSIRALNWIIEGYGTQSAGGNFSGFIVLILLLVLCFAGMIFAYSKSSEKINREMRQIFLVLFCVFGKYACIYRADRFFFLWYRSHNGNFHKYDVHNLCRLYISFYENWG